MKGVMLLSFLLTLSLCVGHISAQNFFSGSFLNHLTTPQRHVIEPLTKPSITFYTKPQQSHLAPRQTSQSTSKHSYIWSNLINSLNFHTPFDSYEPEAEFVPLEDQQQQKNQNGQHGRTNGEKPFEVDVVTTDVNAVGGQHIPGVYFPNEFPFFSNNFFNTYGAFGVGTPDEPWWKGPNVCIVKEEDEKSVDEDNEKEETETEDPKNIVKQAVFDHFQFQFNSCVEKPNKYVCTRVINKNGRKKTLSITRQCCYGYGRRHGAPYVLPCEKIEVKDIESTAAEMGAKEFVAKAKASGLADIIPTRKNVTVFLPSDEAFAAYSDSQQSENNLVEIKFDDSMKQLYLRHMVDGENSFDDLNNEQVLKTEVEGQTIRINSYRRNSEPYRYTANCVPIEKRDKLSEQGMVHTLSGVLKPITKNIMDLIRERSDLSIMRTFLENTKLSEILEGEKPVTIFVPSNAAFEKLEPYWRRALKEGNSCASKILKNHILPMTFCSAASVSSTKTAAYNILGEVIHFNRSKSEDPAIKADQPILINDIAEITEADIMGTNGVMYVIDTVVPPKSAVPLSTLLQEKNVTIFKGLIQAAGLENKFDDMDNATVLAPTNKAFKHTKWPKLLEESPEQLKGNDELISFLNYHILHPMILTCDLQEQLIPTMEGSNVRINLYSTNALLSNVMNAAAINCARLVHFDDESCGSVLHQIDKALQPAKQTVLEMLESNPDYSKFLNLVRMANLTDLLANTENSFTLYVPKNHVFEEVEDSLTKDETELQHVIKTHIVEDIVCCSQLLTTNWPFVRYVNSISGERLRINRERRPQIQNAGVTRCDTIGTNGIIHEINDVIIPPSRKQKMREDFDPILSEYLGHHVSKYSIPFHFPSDTSDDY